ncbi:MAG: ABC-2 family transporter protein [Rectinemataceae bacterium]
MKKYLRLLQIEFRKSREYALNFSAQIVYIPFQMLIYYFLWTAIYRANYGDRLGGFTLEQILFYYLSVLVLKIALMPTGVIAYDIWDDIKSGGLDTYLVKPFSYLLVGFFKKIGYYISAIVIGILVIFACGKIFGLESGIPAGSWLLFLFSSFLGFSIMFLMFGIVGVLTFWLKNVLTLRDVLWNFLMLFSGEIIPLSFLGGAFAFIKYLPTAGVYYYPAAILNGTFPGTDVAKILFFQIGWIAVLSVLISVLWNSGRRKYEAQGG